MNSYEELTKYVGRLYDAAYRKTCDALQAEELTQETLLAAVQTLSRGFVPDRLWSWLLTVLSNKHNDRLREKIQLLLYLYRGLSAGTCGRIRRGAGNGGRGTAGAYPAANWDGWHGCTER